MPVWLTREELSSQKKSRSPLTRSLMEETFCQELTAEKPDALYRLVLTPQVRRQK